MSRRRAILCFVVLALLLLAPAAVDAKRKVQSSMDRCVLCSPPKPCRQLIGLLRVCHVYVCGASVWTALGFRQKKGRKKRKAAPLEVTLNNHQYCQACLHVVETFHECVSADAVAHSTPS